MPRVHHRKARKDYPDHGIKAGDMYYTANMKTGPRSSRTLRSLKPLKPSQLTSSPFKSGFFGVQECWEDAIKDGQAIRDAAEAIRELGESANASYENMPEGLQEGGTGQMLYERSCQCEDKADELDGLADEHDELEEPTEPAEPEEPEEPEEPDDDEAENYRELVDEWETYKDRLTEYEMVKVEYETELDDFEIAQAEYESEQEQIVEKAGELIGDMPE